MPASSREDYLMRLIRQLGETIARLRGLRNGGELQEALRTLDDAQGELLGPLAGVVPRVDPDTAAHMLGDPQRIAAWARLLHERAELLRQAGDPAAADAARHHAAALARAAQTRAQGFERDVRDLLGPLADAG
jgi:hypothetical protein